MRVFILMTMLVRNNDANNNRKHQKHKLSGDRSQAWGHHPGRALPARSCLPPRSQRRQHSGPPWAPLPPALTSTAPPRGAVSAEGSPGSSRS